MNCLKEQQNLANSSQICPAANSNKLPERRRFVARKKADFCLYYSASVRLCGFLCVLL